jgi:hypothetical protein
LRVLTDVNLLAFHGSGTLNATDSVLEGKIQANPDTTADACPAGPRSDGAWDLSLGGDHRTAGADHPNSTLIR